MPEWRMDAPKLLTSLGRRRSLDAVLDRVRFRIDTTSRSGNYQPLPGVGGKPAYRADSTEARWRDMEPIIRELRIGTAVDLGCNAGFFPLQLSHMGIPTVGIEGEDVKFRTFSYAAQHFGGQAAIGQMKMLVSPESVALVPSSEALVLLSVWHHFVQRFTLESATHMLSRLWSQTSKVMFFETGQMEAASAYRLPDMGDNPKAWLAEYLANTCEGALVTSLGDHEAWPQAAESMPT